MKEEVKKTPFTITIDDTFCKWEFGFKPNNYNDLSIEDIVKVIENHFNTKMVYSKLIE